MTQDNNVSSQKAYIPLVAKRIEDWKSRLIDLSKKNNLLYYKPRKRGSLSVSHPDMETIFNALVTRRRNLRFWQPPDETELIMGVGQNSGDLSHFNSHPSKANRLVCEGLNRIELEKTLRNLMTRSLSDYREKGVRILHAAFGMLTWKEEETSEEVRSPLILVPIELRRKSFKDPFAISIPPVEEEAVLNPALQARLRSAFKIELPPLPEDWESQTLAEYLNTLSQTVLDFGWKVKSSVEIGLFSFHKLVIYNDLTANAELIKQHNMVRAIAGVKEQQLAQSDLPEEKDVDEIEPPEKPFHVLDADSSQRVSIQYALRGQSFVMQGPPGTGKSQTIANIIAECIAHGKSVLFVSDKMAALEVVYKRLREVGLSHFCLELHSSKANKQQVVAELKRCLDEQLVPRMLPSEHDFEKMSELRGSLNNYVVSLHQKRPNMQKSAYEILGKLASLEGIPFVPVDLPEVESLTPQRLVELENLASQLKDVWQVVEEVGFPWTDYKGDKYDLETRSEVSFALDSLVSTISQLRIEAARLAGQLGLTEPPTLDRIKWLIEISQRLLESPQPETAWVLSPNVGQLILDAEMYKNNSEWCSKTRAGLLQRYDQSVFNLSLDTSSDIEDRLSSISKLITHPNIAESSLLKKRADFVDYVKRSSDWLEVWNDKSQQLAQILGLSAENLTPEKIRLLSRIGLYCFSDDRPEKSWLESDNLAKVRTLTSKAKSDYQEHNLLFTRLEKTYITDRLLTLDLDELIRCYGTSYQNPLRWLRPSFHRDQKQISLLTHTGKVPESILEDLSDARKLKMLKARITASAEQDRELLGHFYQGYDTDFQGVENAIKKASEILSSYATSPLPDEKATLFSHGSNPPLMIKQLAQPLAESLIEWDKLAKDLDPLVPINRLPTLGLPINETHLNSIREWTRAIERQLFPLCEITDDALETCKAECPEEYKSLIADLRDAETVGKKEAAVLEKRELLQTKFGFRFHDLDTQWEEILKVLDWTEKFQALFGSMIPEPLAKIVSAGVKYAPSNVDLVGYYNTTLNSLNEFESRFESGLTYQCQRLRELNLEAIQRRISGLRERVDDLQVWMDFKKLKNLFSSRDLGAFFGRLVDNRPPSSQLVDVLRKGTYQEWITNLYTKDPNLGQFRRENHEQLIKEFRRLDQELIHLSSNRVIEEANKRKPQDILVQANNSEISILLREAAKKRRIIPVRNLLEKIPNLLFRIKPCMLMSPISVSQFLTPALEQFDLVLFDEASQIVPEDAIGSIYRGKTIVVAGDNKQLPPTSFFQKSMIEDIDWDQISDEDAEVFDSILDESMGIGLPVKTLRWHYRSKHEELIAFSNNHFYDDTLVTFPSPIAERSTLGVKIVYVSDGIYDRGGKRDNPREAEVVADLVFQHLKECPKKTLGVVTFSIAQMEAVADAIDRHRRMQPEFEHFFKEDRLEGFFVKNLENVQGDERDVMMISVGYGYDSESQMTMNFGPINKTGGERRLNVVVTRAREKTVIITSVKASDIRVNSTNSVGVKSLRDYLEYAEEGPQILKSHFEKTDTIESSLEEDVATVVKRAGYKVIPKVGWSGCPIEIGVADPNEPSCYVLGITFDGTTYKSISSARDRDRLRNQVLGQLGWRIHRIWSPTWVSRRESEARRLTDALEECKKQELENEPEGFSQVAYIEGRVGQSDRVDVRRVQFAGPEKIGAPYRVHPLKAVFSSSVMVPVSGYRWTTKANEFYFEENRPLQGRLLEELVNAEGPVHFDYAVKRLADAWGLKRIGPRVVLAIREARDLLLKNHKIVENEKFLWPIDLKDALVRTPVKDVPESKRAVEHIPPEEIGNALLFIAKYSIGINSESLLTETAKVFGFNRTGENVREAIQEVYQRMLSDRKLVCANDIVTVPS